MPKFDDRFARQNRCEPPPEFPLASPCSGIVHHLSGPNRYARTQTFHRRSWSVDGAGISHPTSQVTCVSWVLNPPARIHVRLLGPCFKTGELKAFCQHLEGAVPEGLNEHLSNPRPLGRHALSEGKLLSRSNSRC